MRILITGGVGFIGCNVAKACLERGDEVSLLDNLSRPGAEENLKWLKEKGKFEFVKIDIRDQKKLFGYFKESAPFDAILHFAGQVAVTTSVLEPLEDFEINAQGTVNLLEASRRRSQDTLFLFSSTNKVYGALENTPLIEKKDRYTFKSLEKGVSEEHPLDFHSPYGCSKGSADQYVRDYARIYGLKTVVFRQSCIYGPRQFGVEDQGWVAWFMIARELGLAVTIYGDGKQVRDLLHIDDLSRAIFQVLGRIDKVKGEVFNIGGGALNTLSVLELVAQLKKEEPNCSWKISFLDPRPGDQRIYVSNIQKAERLLDWQPLIGVEEGLKGLRHWIRENRSILEKRRIPESPSFRQRPPLSVSV